VQVSLLGFKFLDDYLNGSQSDWIIRRLSLAPEPLYGFVNSDAFLNTCSPID